MNEKCHTQVVVTAAEDTDSLPRVGIPMVWVNGSAVGTRGSVQGPQTQDVTSKDCSQAVNEGAGPRRLVHPVLCSPLVLFSVGPAQSWH